MNMVSIIIPAHNESAVIERCLKALKKQTYANIEIIVIDNNSTDNTKEIAEKYADKVVSAEKKGITFAKNVGVKTASGELIACTDADCVPEPNWIEELVKEFKTDEIGSVGGPNLTPKDETAFGNCVGIVLEFLSKPGSRYGTTAKAVEETFHNPGCNVMHRKEVFDKIGGFNTTLETCEDAELDHRCLQAGYKILCNPSAIVHHYRRLTWKKFFKQAYRYAIGRIQAVRIYPKMGSYFHYLPLLNTIALIMLFLLSFVSNTFLVLFSLAVLAEFFSLLMAGMYISLKSKPTYFINIIFLIVIWYIGWTYGSVLGLFRDVKRNEGSAITT